MSGDACTATADESPAPESCRLGRRGADGARRRPRRRRVRGRLRPPRLGRLFARVSHDGPAVAGRGGCPGRLHDGLADGASLPAGTRQPALMAAVDRSQPGHRRTAPGGRPRPAARVRRARGRRPGGGRAHRRRGDASHGGPGRAGGPGGAAAGAAAGHRAGVLRWLHAHRDREHARPAAGHREGADAPRAGEAATTAGGGGCVTIRDHAEYEEAVGAYVLDALPELEAEVFERHMLRCNECREQVERLQPSVDALPRAVPQVPAPPGLKSRLMAEVRADAADEAARDRTARRRGSWRPSMSWGMAAAAAVVLGFAVYGVYDLAQGGSSDTVTAMVDTHRLAQNASAKLDLLDGGDTAILHVAGLPSPGAGRVYQVWLKRGEPSEPVSAFDVDAKGDGAAAIPQVTHGADAVMVTRERSGGATMPGEIPVIVANV